ncbi:hypothetical protein D5Q69_25000 [Escherichia coli]|nr:hypothetical protein [Escherichia coli]
MRMTGQVLTGRRTEVQYIQQQKRVCRVEAPPLPPHKRAKEWRRERQDTQFPPLNETERETKRQNIKEKKHDA